MIRKYMVDKKKEERVAELQKQHEEEERRKAIKTRLLALEMRRREGYVRIGRVRFRTFGASPLTHSLQCRVISEGQGSRTGKREEGGEQ